MPDHTPGPWRVENILEGSNLPEGITLCITDEHDEDVAYLSPCDEKEMIANTRLIAAAPMLLFALKSIVADLPKRRNWLDPQTESLALDAIAQTNTGE